LILETIAGQKRDAEVCQRLGICEQRFRQLVVELLQAALERLEGLPPGRPRRAEESEDTRVLRQQVEALDREFQVAEVREEIALAVPGAAASSPQKKRN
jgi:hypothetical protein